ncbi:hypothetical protein EIP86_001393 [Pleurotus ostreatoroseus]|nr:hypothetical protein EIP86_001393 [Pleurotus ostreatoroseus]
MRPKPRRKPRKPSSKAKTGVSRSTTPAGESDEQNISLNEPATSILEPARPASQRITTRPLSSNAIVNEPSDAAELADPSVAGSSTLVETPATGRLTYSLNFLHGTLPIRKAGLCKDLNSVAREVTLEHYLENVSPTLREGVVPDRVVEKLTDAGTIKDKCFTTFNAQPKHISGHEDDVFKDGFQKMVNAIIEAATSDDIVPTMKFFHNGRRVPKSKVANNATRPDSYSILVESVGKPLFWIDLGLPGEAKKYDTECKRLENEEQEAWNLYMCMLEDPRRERVFGFTVENTQMRLWYCSRVDLLISTAFNFMTDYKSTIKFFLSVMFATKEQLGWDPTMRLRDDGQLDIDVRSEDGIVTTYRTQRIVSDKEADSLVGAGTRTWVVREVRASDDEEFGPLLMLKDTWVDKDRRREGVSCQRLRAVTQSSSAFKKMGQFLMPVIVHGNVHIDGVPNNTEDRMMRCKIPTESPRYSLARTQEDKLQDSANQRFHDAVTPGSPRLLDLPSKTRYRIVTENVCRPLDELTTPSLIFRSLGKAVYAVCAMHEVGWVHRYLTPENILVDELGNITFRGLDYAKSMHSDDDHAKHSHISVVDFVAVEMALGFYSHTSKRGPVPSQSKSSALDRLFGGTKDTNRYDSIGAVEVIDQVPAIFNPLHDLESLWWCAVYFVVVFMIKIEEALVPHSDEQLGLVKLLFHDYPGVARARHSFLNHKLPLSDIHPLLVPTFVILDDLRQALVKTSKAIEADISKIDHTVGRALLDPFCLAFVDIADGLEKSNITLHPFKSTASLKRPRQDDSLPPSKRAKRDE